MPSTTSPLTSYTIQFEVELAAKQSAVWKALTKKLNAWWPSTFYSNEKTKAFVMEPEVGGKIYEDWGKQAGGEWGRLIVFLPDEKLVWTGTHFGSQGKNWGHFFVVIQLKAHEQGVTLSFEDSGYGMLESSMRDSLEQGWKELFGQHLKEYVERKGKK